MIIGITGTDGAGKGSAVAYLVKQRNYTHFSSRALLIEELVKRGRSADDRNQLRLMGNELRRDFGNDFLVQKALERIEELKIEHAVIESIRAVAEVETLHNHNGILLAIDADPKIRYERITSRKSESDNTTLEEFLAQEEVEMNDPDPNGMQKRKVMDMADYTIFNDGTYTDLYKQLDKFISEFLNGN